MALSLFNWNAKDSLAQLYDSYNKNLIKLKDSEESLTTTITENYKEFVKLRDSGGATAISLPLITPEVAATFKEPRAYAVDNQEEVFPGTGTTGGADFMIGVSYGICFDFAKGSPWAVANGEYAKILTSTDPYFEPMPVCSINGEYYGLSSKYFTGDPYYFWTSAGVWAKGDDSICFTSKNRIVKFNNTPLGSAFPVDTFQFCNGLDSSPTGTIQAGQIWCTRVNNTTFNDYAEWFPRGEATEAGDIIALDLDSDKELYRKAKEGDLCVVGVHSDEYAILIGGETPSVNEDGSVTDPFDTNIGNYIPVGLMGRVYVKFTGVAKKGTKVVPSSLSGVGRAYNPETDNLDSVVGVLVENNSEEGVRRVKVKLK